MQKISGSVYFLSGEGYDSNTIIITGPDPFIVDTGTGQNPEKLINALRELEVEPTAIVNTHCHYDHVGGNHLFKIPVYAHPPDDGHIRCADAHCVAPMFNTRLEPQAVEPLGNEFRGWRVIHTPGHTEGSCCLLKDKILISGDTIFAEGIGRMDCPGGSEEAMQKSLALLEALEYKVLLPGHGPSLHR